MTNANTTGGRPLYTPDERIRRDASIWTYVQGVLAPVQFAVFLVSLWLVVSCLLTGEGSQAATISIVIKTITLYAIMITGSIWEKEVFGKYLFADAFFWEDVVSMLVLALHTAYLVVLYYGIFDTRTQLILALAAYASYVVNAGQFLLKLRAARLDSARLDSARLDSARIEAAQPQRTAPPAARRENMRPATSMATAAEGAS